MGSYSRGSNDECGSQPRSGNRCIESNLAVIANLGGPNRKTGRGSVRLDGNGGRNCYLERCGAQRDDDPSGRSGFESVIVPVAHWLAVTIFGLTVIDATGLAIAGFS